MKKLRWTISRRREIQKLQTLLREVSTINRGNHCLERIEQCIKIAEQLARTNLNTGRSSFVSFLIEVAHEDKRGVSRIIPTTGANTGGAKQ